MITDSDISDLEIEPEPELEASDDLEAVPWGQRPAWDYERSGGPTPWAVDPRPEARERKDRPAAEPVRGRVTIPSHDGLVDLAAPPPAYVTMRAKAEKAGWACHRRWAAADVAVRKLVAAGEDEEHGHYETTLVATLSVSLRMSRDGHRAYALWSVSEAPGAKWAYVGGGLDGIHGVKVTALGKALLARFQHEA